METELKKNILSRILSRINYRWQNFIEDMFGMGNFSCQSYKNEQQKTQSDVKLLRQSIDYLKQLNDKYENETNPLNDTLKKNIETLTDTIKQNNKLKSTKEKYRLFREC